jgi:two-component system CheB/CheR fusion protein
LIKESDAAPRPFPVVGIGASAGGLEAISSLLTHLKPDLGMAYVIVQHLSPDHESLLPELLERKTTMKVHQVTDGIKIEPNNIYVIPEASYMSIADGHLALAHRNKTDKEYRIIDFFLETLAPVYQNNAIAVILSGVGSDGTRGVQAIKTEGGITFAQNDSALFHAMARNAYESGYVDIIQSPEGIANELAALSRQNYAHSTPGEPQEINEGDIQQIQSLVFKHCGVDFSSYKRATIHRRILRRMALKRLHNLEDYIEVLKENPSETELLYRGLLINVTYFFREPDLFIKLTKQVFPQLLSNRRSADPIRIWIPACSSGEEAFSMGIALFEFLGDKIISTPVQIFATDLSDAAIERARQGIYSKNSLQNVNPQRLKQFFTKIDGNFQIIKPIRDICIFASHNLLKDPPFSKIDLISCQNVLIYLSPNAQKKILQAFHYALKQASCLVLGKSESIGNDTELFEQIDKENKIYQKKTVAANLHFDFLSKFRPSPINNYTLTEKLLTPANTESDIEKESDRILLSKYAPASVVINKDLQILRFQGPINNYLQPASGKASLHLLKMVKNELVFELRGLLNKVKKEKQSIKKDGIHLSENGLEQQICIEITPVKSFNEDACYLIVFMESRVNHLSGIAVPVKDGHSEDGKSKRIQTLQLELREAREHMKSMNEDFEATREELQSANEEVLSSNEELQSINEELETSKEELQSTNEELTTINEELQLRNADLKESVEYVKAIVETIREPLVVLHTDLRIRTANRAFYSIFGLKENVEGLFFYDVSNGLFDLEELKTQLLKTISRGVDFQDFELNIKTRTTGEKILLFNAMRMIAEGGKRTRILLAIERRSQSAGRQKKI